MTFIYWLVEYVATLIETFLCYKFSEVFVANNEEINKHRNKLIIVISLMYSIVIMIVNRINLFSVVNGFIGLLSLIVIQAIVYRRKYGVITLLTMIYAVIVSALDFSIAQMGAISFGVQTEYLLNIQSLKRCQCVIISKIILCVVIYFFNKYAKNKMELPKKYIGIICLIAAVLVSLDYYIIEIVSEENVKEMKNFSIMFFVASIIMIILIFVFVLKMSENYKQKQEVSLLKLQNDMIYKAEQNTEKVFELWRSSIHDYKHKIIAMKHWIEKGNISELEAFLNRESKELDKGAVLVKTGNAIVDAVINTKLNVAKQSGIRISTDIILSSVAKIDDMDMVCILGNLIDNAIEACEKQNEKSIDVTIKEVKKMLIIKISNSFEGNMPDCFCTSKEEKVMHGIGIKNVRSIVDKYDGEFILSKEQDKVVANIMLMNKKV